jgi:outer membrane protein TolC
MRRLSPTLKTTLILVLAVLTGCSPSQPFYLRESGDMSHYLDKATKIEHPDVHAAPLAEVEQAKAPITLSNPEFDELWDLTLQECIHIALANTKVIRGGQIPRLQQGQIIAGTQEGSLTDVPLGFLTVYNPALRESGVGGEFGTGVEAALAAFDAQARVFGSQGNNSIFSLTDRPQNVTQQFTGFPSVLNLRNGGLISSLSKKAATGTTFTALNQTDLAAGNQRGQFQALNSVWTTTLEARVDQPLLRGRGEQVNRMPVIIARIGTDTEIAALEDQLQKMVDNIEIRYWDLHRSYRDLETAKTARDTTLTTWRTVYERFTQGVDPAQSEAQSRQQYFEFRSAVETALRDLHNNENELRLLMGISVSDGRLIRPIDEPTMARVTFNWNEVLAEAVVKRPELRQRRWEIKRREMELILARNQLLPQLDVGGFYRWVGVGDALITANRRDAVFPAPGSTAADSLLGGNFQEFGFSGQFAYNIGMRRELAGVRNAQLNLAREKAYLEDMELDVSHSLARGIRNMDANYTLAQTHFNRWVAADREVKSATAVYEQGVGQGITPLNQLLDAVRRRGIAQQAYYLAICEYNKSIADVHMRKGSILEYNGVMFEEGPWSKKAYWDALGRARERDASTYLDYGWTRPKVISQGEQPSHAGPMPMPADGMEVLPTAPATPNNEGGVMPESQPESGVPNELGPSASLGNRSAGAVASAGGGNMSAPAAKNDLYWGEFGLTSSPGSVKTGAVQPASHVEESQPRPHVSQAYTTNYPAAGSAPGRTSP